MPESNNAPLIQLEEGGSAPILRYDIPEPTSYEGKNFIELNFDDDIFVEEAFKMARWEKASRLSTLSSDAIRSEVNRYLRTGVSARIELPNIRRGALHPSARIFESIREPGDEAPQPPHPLPDDDDDGDSDGLVEIISNGNYLVMTHTVDGESNVTEMPIPTDPDPHLYLIESIRLTSFLGDYGAGRIVKTFSLLPGESTKISVKTYRQRESTRKSSSSVLDSLTHESATDLEESLLREQSNQNSYQKTKEYYVDAEASSSWGFGSASVKAGLKGGTNAAREEAVKNVSNATQKHSAKASAKREVEINTNYEITEKEGEELSTERTIENINLSRTLNFVFRQMNQEFISFLHLTDIRVGFFNGHSESRREVPISSLDTLLEEIVVSDKRDLVRDVILDQISAIRNRDGALVDVAKTVGISPNDVYRQFDSNLTSIFEDDNGRRFEVPGVLLKVDHHVMRTEGVMVEALLGNGSALDSYATQLQELEVGRREAEVAGETASAETFRLINEAVRDNDAERAGLLKDLTCPCKPENTALRVTLDSREHEGQSQ